MTGFANILLPTDFSDCARPAYGLAAQIAERFSSKLFLLHVVQDLTLLVPDAVLFAASPNEALDSLIAGAKTQLEQIVRQHQLERFTPTLQVQVGSPAVEIVEYAKEINASLIVIATHGRTGLQQLLLGSVANRVVQVAPCPVLTVRSQ
jgi:nucleotide-binding universal stress UspA family protein